MWAGEFERADDLPRGSRERQLRWLNIVKPSLSQRNVDTPNYDRTGATTSQCIVNLFI